MKKHNLPLNLALIALGIIMCLAACKKKETTTPDPVTPVVEETGQSGSDNSTVQSENDAAINDINTILGDQTDLQGKGASTQDMASVTGTICGLSIDTAGIKRGTVRLNYNGITCNNRTRTGSIRLTVLDYNKGKRWKNQGCIIQVDYLAYKITRASDGKSVLLNGTQFLTNVTGGSWGVLFLQIQTSLVTTITGTNLNVTFEDGKTAVYNINRRLTYTYPSGILVFKGEGIGSTNGLNNLENYGTTRNGENFTSQITTPIMWNTTCGPGAPVQGLVNIKVTGKDFDIKVVYAVDKNGKPQTLGPNDCAYGWKVEWTTGGKTDFKLTPYN